MPIFGGGAADAAEDAADVQSDYLEKALGFQKKIYRQGRRDLSPYRKQGYAALNLLGQMYGLPPITRRVVSNKYKKWRNQGGEDGSSGAAAEGPTEDMSMGQWLEFLQGGTGRDNIRDTGAFGENITDMIPAGSEDEGGGRGDAPKKFKRKQMTDYGDVGELIRNQPGYQFRLGEGLRGIDQSAASRGRLYSGGQLREVTRYGQDYASNEFDKVASRLAQIAGLGGGATQSSANLGANASQEIGSTYAGIGSARASGYVGAANARSQGFSNVLRLGGAAVGAFA